MLGQAKGARRQWLAIGLAGAATLGLAAWVRRDASFARVQARGLLRVGVAIEPPYAMLNPDGEPSGESPGVARAVSAALQLRPAWIVTPFERLLPELEAARFDLVAAGLFVTDERARRVRFCRPQLRVRPGWLVQPGNPRGLGAYADLGAGPGPRLAVLAGSVEEAEFVRRGVPAARLLHLPDANTGAAAVATGAADGLALSWPSVSHLARAAGQGLQAVPAPGPAAALVAMAVRRDEGALQRAIDGVLAPYLHSAAHLALLQPLGLGAADIPSDHDARN